MFVAIFACTALLGCYDPLYAPSPQSASQTAQTSSEYPNAQTSSGYTTTQGPEPFRFIALESLSEDHFYLDTISITLPDGTVLFPTTVEDLGGIAPDGNFTDDRAALGPPDSRCQLQNVVDLGSRENGGYIVVGFANDTQEGSFPSGSTITVYTLGQDMCPDSDFVDKPYALLFTVSKDTNAWPTATAYARGMGPHTIPDL